MMTSKSNLFKNYLRPFINKLLVPLSILLVFCSGCGTFTKMRYSNGFKSSLDWRSGHDEKTDEVFKALKAGKVQRKQPSIIQNKTMTAVDSSIINSIPEIVEDNEPIFSISEKAHAKQSTLIMKTSSHVKESFKKEEEKKPIEPNIKAAIALFFSGIFFLFLSLFLLVIPFLSILGILMFIASLIFAIVGLIKIPDTSGKYRGTGWGVILILLNLLMVLVAFGGLLFLSEAFIFTV